VTAREPKELRDLLAIQWTLLKRDRSEAGRKKTRAYMDVLLEKYYEALLREAERSLGDESVSP
jgi:hypothetical protein